MESFDFVWFGSVWVGLTLFDLVWLGLKEIQQLLFLRFKFVLFVSLCGNITKILCIETIIFSIDQKYKRTLQVSIGQFLSVGGLGIFKISPIFKVFQFINITRIKNNELKMLTLQGVGYAATVMACWLNVYYIVVLSWGLYYFWSSLQAGEKSSLSFL